jgi:archaeal flagellin FlaB
VKWQYLQLTAILILMVCATACINDEAPPPEARSPANPGQAMVAIGDVTGNGIPGGLIDTITFTVGLAPGAKPVNMENLSIIYADAVRSETLKAVAGLRGNPPQGFWGVIEVKNPEGISNNLLEFDEEFVIRINPKAPLVPGQFIMVVVEPPSGRPLTLRRVSPPAILEGNNILTAM